MIILIILVVFLYIGIREKQKEKERREEKMRKMSTRAKKFAALYPSIYYKRFNKLSFTSLSDEELLSLAYVSEEDWKKQQIDVDVRQEKLFFKTWGIRQSKFSEECIKSCEMTNKTWGHYCYDVLIEDTLVDKEFYQHKVTIWELFMRSFCANMSLDYSSAPEKKDNYDLLSKYRTCERKLPEEFSLQIFNYIAYLSKSEENIHIIFADSGMSDNADEFNNFHFEVLKTKMNGIYNYYSFNDYINSSIKPTNASFVIIEMIANNEKLKDNCLSIIDSTQYKEIKYRNEYSYFNSSRGALLISMSPYDLMYNVETLGSYKFETRKESKVPNIVYIAVYKEMSTSEMTSIIEKRRSEFLEKNIEKFDEDLAENVGGSSFMEGCQNIEESLKISVQEWYCPVKSTVKCFSMFYYYPTNCDVMVDNSDWAVRNLIWDFKADPPTPTSLEIIIQKQEYAIARIVDLMSDCLKSFFKDNVKYLTLVCVPSSKEVVNKRRYENFSERICKLSHMENGFSYVKIIMDGDAKHLGGTTVAKYEIDENFFRGKYVLLFDDVISSGKSMERLRILLENKGAIVIGGFSIGRTIHEKQNGQPIDKLG